MSTDLIAMLSALLVLGIAIFAGFAWVVRRVDGRIETLDTKLSTRIDAVDTKLSTRIDAVDTKLSTRIDAVESALSTRIDAVENALRARIDAIARDTTDLKIAVARIEGPPRHLLPVR